MAPRRLSQAQQHYRSGCEPGSLMASFTPEQRKAYQAWMKKRDADLRSELAGYRRIGATVPSGQGTAVYK